MTIRSITNILSNTINLQSASGKTYICASANALPYTDITVGSQAYTQDLGKLYMWTGTHWVNVALTPPPPPGTLYGWFSGYRLSTVERVEYANDSIIAVARGSVAILRDALAATGNAEYGWFGGGATPAILSTVERIDYRNDNTIASIRGPLSLARESQLAATGNTNYGWFGAGGTPATVSTVDRIDYAADTSIASIRGPLSLARTSLAAAGNTNYGWFGGGYPGPLSTVDRIDYSVDTNVALVKGSLSIAHRLHSATGNDNYGWFAGGLTWPTPYVSISKVDRIDYSSDTSISLSRGNLSIGKDRSGATGNDNYGWFAAGNYFGTGAITIVDRIDYAADTGTAAVRGPLSLPRYGLAATGGYPG